MSGDASLVRQWKIVAALSARTTGETVANLAREHAVNNKTIRRDLVTLRRAGFPLVETVGDFGRKTWQLSPEQSLPPMTLNWLEAISLYLARQFLEPLAGTHFWTSADKAFGKLRATLGKQPLQYLEKMSAAFFHTTGRRNRYAAKADILDDLTRAIEERRVSQLSYQSERSTEPATRDIHPLGWVFHGGAAYLVAHAPDHGERRLYKLDRMERVHVTSLQVPAPIDFSLNDYLANSFGVYRGDAAAQCVTIRVRFLPQVARYVSEKQWHASQKLEPQADGTLLAEFQLTSTVELKSWLRSFGANAIVLEPAPLRDEIQAELREWLGLYGKQPAKAARKGRGGDVKRRSRKPR
jgi:proteasome accessory factor B